MLPHGPRRPAGKPRLTGQLLSILNITPRENMFLHGVKDIPTYFNMQTYSSVKKNAAEGTNIKEAIVSLTLSWPLPGLCMDVTS